MSFAFDGDRFPFFKRVLPVELLPETLDLAQEIEAGGGNDQAETD